MKYKINLEKLKAIQCDPWLTDRERTVFDLFYRRGWRIADIAASIDKNGKLYEDKAEVNIQDKGVSSSTIKRDLKIIRAKLEENDT